MAMTAVLTQNTVAELSGLKLNLAISNSGASALTVTIHPMVSSPNGVAYSSAPAYISQPDPVSVGASATVNVTLNVQLYGHVVTGGPATPSNQFLIAADMLASDGTVFFPPSLLVALSSPTLGQPGSPPNLVPAVGQLIFSTPAQSGLTL